jgi:DNA-binding Xre family transcriptional regulator
MMIKKHISIYKLSKLTGLKYEVIVRYYSNNITKYDSYVLAKLCFVLECSINDLLKYEV